MPTGEARYIKKKVKTGTVDIHPTENCLVVNYEVEALILGDDGQPMIGDQKKCQKLIRFHSLNPATNCAALAKDVINKCKLIHPSKLDEVQHLLRYLQYRRQCAPSITVKSNESIDSTSFEEPAAGKNEEKANLLDLEDYIELLYDEMSDKIKGSGLILQLCKDNSNLDELTKNESLLSVLSRVLREDWKKNLDLSINLVNIFQSFSEYTVFHHILLQQKIGSLCIEMITHELKKYDEMKNGAETPNEETVDKTKSFRSRLPVPRSAKSALSPDSQRSRSQIPVKSNRRYSLAIDDKKDDQKLNEENRRYSALIPNSVSITDHLKPEQNARRIEVIAKKQDQLFTVCFSLLLNISENEKIQDKMRKRNIINLLVQALDRKSIQLLSMVIRFLQKLSVYKENKDAMASLDIIEKLPRILMLSLKEDNPLLNNILPLMFNLSFDRKFSEQMIRVGFLPELVNMAEKYRTTKNRKYILGLLYHFTMDDRVKSMFAYTDSMNVIINMLLDPEVGNDPIFKALCVNLALNNKNAETLCDYRCISTIMEKAFNNKDAVFMKIARNIVSHPSTKHMFEIYAPEIAKSVKLYIHSNKEFACECIGFLANLSTVDVDFHALFEKFQLFSLIGQCFKNLDYVTDDVRLELLILLGTVAYDESMADSLFQKKMLSLLINHIKDKQEDDEVVLQIIFIFYQVLQHPLTRDFVTTQTDAPLYFIDLLHDNNPNIRKICRACLDIIKDFDDTWTERVKLEKFQWHNSNWLEMIQNQMLNTGAFDKAFSDGNDDDVLPNYDLFQQSLMFQSGSHLSLSVDGSVEVISNTMNSEESSQSLSEYNSDADFDLEFSRKRCYNDKFDSREGLSNLIFADNGGSVEI